MLSLILMYLKNLFVLLCFSVENMNLEALIIIVIFVRLDALKFQRIFNRKTIFYLRIDDCSDYEELLEAMNLLDFSDSERDAIFSIIAAILHLGNIEFQNTGDRACKIRDISPLNSAARLLEVPTDQLIRGLTVKQFRIVGQKNTDVTLSDKEAHDTRDALAKFIYGAMFDWIVQKINKSMVLAVSNASSTAGPVKSAGFGVKMNTGAPATSGNAPAPSFNPNKCIGVYIFRLILCYIDFGHFWF